MNSNSRPDIPASGSGSSLDRDEPQEMLVFSEEAELTVVPSAEMLRLEEEDRVREERWAQMVADDPLLLSDNEGDEVEQSADSEGDDMKGQSCSSPMTKVGIDMQAPKPIHASSMTSMKNNFKGHVVMSKPIVTVSDGRDVDSPTHRLIPVERKEDESSDVVSRHTTFERMA